MPRRNVVTVAGVGEVFGRLTVIGIGDRVQGGRRVARVCRCECGKVVRVIPGKLCNGHTKSCGCFRSTAPKERWAKRPRKYTPEEMAAYGSWRSMLDRCHNPNSKDYERYGARGITVCERWRKSLKTFAADMGPRPAGTTVDRLDNDKGYEPGNCRWATPDVQTLNRRSTVLVEFEGLALTLSEWARRTGIKRVTLNQRLRLGWPVRKALTQPVSAYERQRT